LPDADGGRLRGLERLSVRLTPA